MTLKENTGLDFIIEKLTRSIENVVTGDCFPTEITLINIQDLKLVTKKNDWMFTWKTEFGYKEREIYKLTILTIQGLFKD